MYLRYMYTAYIVRRTLYTYKIHICILYPLHIQIGARDNRIAYACNICQIIKVGHVPLLSVRIIYHIHLNNKYHKSINDYLLIYL